MLMDDHQELTLPARKMRSGESELRFATDGYLIANLPAYKNQARALAVDLQTLPEARYA